MKFKFLFQFKCQDEEIKCPSPNRNPPLCHPAAKCNVGPPRVRCLCCLFHDADRQLLLPLLEQAIPATTYRQATVARVCKEMLQGIGWAAAAASSRSRQSGNISNHSSSVRSSSRWTAAAAAAAAATAAAASHNSSRRTHSNLDRHNLHFVRKFKFCKPKFKFRARNLNFVLNNLSFARKI